MIDHTRTGWLITGRWIAALASLGTALSGLRAGAAAVGSADLILDTAIVTALIAVSNLVLLHRARAGVGLRSRVAGALVCLDLLLFSWLLTRAGGALNPAATFYLVEIVLAALVIGRAWAWSVSLLAAASYGAIFMQPAAELRAAQVMHPGIALHMQGMWVAFTATAAAIAFLATRFVRLLERREAELLTLQDRTARQKRAESLATAVAGTAHELSSPLATVAVAAHELEAALAGRPDVADLVDDAKLIRAQVDRCRDILDQMAGRFSGPTGEAPARVQVEEVVAAAVHRLAASDTPRVRVDFSSTPATTVVWPRQVVEQALANLLRNGLQASTGVVVLDVDSRDSRVIVRVRDDGAGMPPDVLASAGEPFFTTRPSGMGLGLFVTRASIEALGGAVTIASAPKAGTTVTISLPMDVTVSEGGADPKGSAYISDGAAYISDRSASTFNGSAYISDEAAERRKGTGV